MTEARDDSIARLMGEILQSDEIVGDVEAANGSRFVVERRDPPGVVVSVEPRRSEAEDAMRMTKFELDGDPPSDYPDDLPFVAGTRVIVVERIDGAQRHASWIEVDDTAGIEAELLRQSHAAGWEDAESSMPMRTLRRGSATRAIFTGPPLPDGQVQLMEFCGEESPTA